jgi:hypothetical protein
MRERRSHGPIVVILPIIQQIGELKIKRNPMFPSEDVQENDFYLFQISKR